MPSRDEAASPVTDGNAEKPDVVLSDGGVYDNLGLETAWKRYRDRGVG